MVVVCGNSDEQIINSQTKTKKLVSLHKRGINMYFCTEPLITTTFIGQPIVIACPQQASNNHMELQNTYRNFSSSLRFSVFVWMAENDSNTLSVDGYFIFFL